MNDGGSLIGPNLLLCINDVIVYRQRLFTSCMNDGGSLAGLDLKSCINDVVVSCINDA